MNNKGISLTKDSKSYHPSTQKQHLGRILFFLLTLVSLTLQDGEQIGLFLSQKPNQKRRNLQTQTFVNYTIKESLSSACSGYSRKDLAFTYQDIVTGDKSLKKYFKYARGSAKNYMETKDVSYLYGIGWRTFWATLPVTFAAIVSFGLIFIIPMTFCCRGPCSKCFGNIEEEVIEEDDDQETVSKKYENREKREKAQLKVNNQKCKMIVFFSSLFCSVALVILTIIWAVYAFNSLAGIKKAECSTSILANDIKNGINSDSSFFLGTNGINSFFGILYSELDQLKSQQPNVDNIKSKAFKTQSDLVNTALFDHFKLFISKTVSSCRGNGIETRPDSVTSLTPKINAMIETEVNTLATVANNIQQGSILISNFNDAALAGYKATISNIMNQVNGFSTSITKSVEYLGAKYMNYESRKPLITLHIWTNLLLIIISLTIFIIFIILNVSFNKAKKSAVFFQGFSAFLIVFLALLMNVTGLITLIASAVGTNLCYYGKLSLTDKYWSTKILGASTNKYFEHCFYDSSSGNLDGTLTGTDNIKYEELKTMINGFTFDQASLNLDITSLKALDDYKTNSLNTWLGYSKSDYTDKTIIEESPEKQLPLINTYLKCIENEIQVDKAKCTKTPTSALADAENYRSAISYCLVPSLFAPKTILQRYTLANSVCAAPSVPYYQYLKKCVDQHDTLITDMITNVDGPVKTAVSNLKGLFTSITADLQGVKTSISKTSQFMDLIPGSSENRLKKITECSIVKDRVYSSVGTLCYELMHNLTIQSIFMVIMGPMMTIFSVLGCISVLQTDLSQRTESVTEKYHEVLQKRQETFGFEVDLVKTILPSKYEVRKSAYSKQMRHSKTKKDKQTLNKKKSKSRIRKRKLSKSDSKSDSDEE